MRTLGTLSLDGPPDGALRLLRKKDLALLAYLVVDARPRHSRSLLAGMLWGDAPEDRARHSLSQAVGRLQRVLGAGTVATSGGFVELRGTVESDARLLRDTSHTPVPDYPGDFLAGFTPGPGAEAFEEWADGVRASLRNTAVQRLDAAASAAEARADWHAVLAHAQRCVRVDPCREQAHRRIMRAWRALGEAPRALEHFEHHRRWLLRELGESSDPETAQLAEEIRGSLAAAALVAPAAPVAMEPADPAGPPPPEPELAPAPPPPPRRPPRRGWKRTRSLAVAAAATACLLAIAVRTGLPGASRGREAGGGCAPGQAVARFAGETMPDNVPVVPGDRFTTSWTLRNTGPCAWSTEFYLQFESAAEPLAVARRRLRLHRAVPPGDTVTLSLAMRAPTEPGVYREHWSLRDPEQAIVPVSSSNTVWTKIIVPSPHVALCTANDAVAKLVDESHSDDSQVAAGQAFTKRWRLRNGGHCAWHPGFALRYAAATPQRLGSSGVTRLGRRVEPGQTHDVLIPMRAPATPGTYREDWSFHDLTGDTIRVSGSRTIWTRIAAVRASQPRADTAVDP